MAANETRDGRPSPSPILIASLAAVLSLGARPMLRAQEARQPLDAPVSRAVSHGDGDVDGRIAQDESADAPDPDNQATKSKSKPSSKKKGAKQRASKEPARGFAFHLDQHPSVTIGSVAKLDFKARLEGDLRMATPDIGLDEARPDWNDRRVGLEGTVFKKIEFEIARELGDDFEVVAGLREKSPWRDVYANVRVIKGLQVQAGRFKLPFGREELTGETNRDFVYRSLAARVVSPGRDTGAMVHGQLADRRLGYQFGYFTRDGDNGRTNTTQGGHEGFAARLVVRPFEQASAPTGRLQIGAAFADSRLVEQLGLRGRTVLGDGIFFDRVFVNGRRKRVGFELEWAGGPVSLSSEYIAVADERKGMGFDNEDLPDVGSRAWYLAGTWAVTGEAKHGRVEPRRGLPGGGVGAVELALRLEALRFDDVVYPGAAFGFPTPSGLRANADRVGTIGINWYVNRYMKIQTNVIVESVDDPQRSPAPASSGRFVTTIVRLQLAL